MYHVSKTRFYHFDLEMGVKSLWGENHFENGHKKMSTCILSNEYFMLLQLVIHCWYSHPSLFVNVSTPQSHWSGLIALTKPAHGSY